MKIVIVAAMDKEVVLLRELMPEAKTSELDGVKIYEGKIFGHDVVLAKCGIGKVNSALRTYRLIETYNPELVINSGVAGGADITAPIGTVMVADAVAYHDVWCGPGTDEGAADGFPQKFIPYHRGLEVIEQLKDNFSDLQTGLIATGDIFISKPEEIATIKSLYPEATACDMESASIAQTCEFCGVPFMVVRVVSDMPGGGNNLSEYKNFWSEAPEKTFHVVGELLKSLSN